MRAVLSIGSNMGDRYEHLKTAFDFFADELTSYSKIYSTQPWGGVEQQAFLNAILIIDTHSSPLSLLRSAQYLELQRGRERTLRWGPRTLDVDIISYQGVTSLDPVLRLPHPEAGNRAFVLLPWLEIEPDAILGRHKVADLIKELPEEERAGVIPVTEFSHLSGGE